MLRRFLEVLARLAAVAAVLAGVPVARAAIGPNEPVRDLSVLYLDQAVATAVAGPDSAPTVPGAWIQAPTGNDPRWPAERQVGKVSGATFVTMTAAEMAKTLSTELARRDRGGLVSIDEILTPRWTEQAARELGGALDRLGPDARRVVVYVGPGLVGAVGLVDPREPLAQPLGALLDAFARAGVVYLEAYHGDVSPFTAEEFARETTRWVGRWQGDAERLRLMLGPAIGTTQQEVWRRARATAAGRSLLANRPGAYGLRDVAEGGAWLAQYRAFLADPAGSPPGGDATVPTGGGLTLRAATGGVFVAFTRPGSASVRLIPPAGGAGRIIKTIQGPTSTDGVLVPFSRHEPPGRHRVVVVAKGDGLSDEATVDVTITAPVRLTAPVVRRLGARTLAIRVTPGARVVVVLRRLSDGRSRVIRSVSRTAGSLRVVVPADTRPGAYRVLVSTSLAGRRAAATAALSIS